MLRCSVMILRMRLPERAPAKSVPLICSADSDQFSPLCTSCFARLRSRRSLVVVARLRACCRVRSETTLDVLVLSFRFAKRFTAAPSTTRPERDSAQDRQQRLTVFANRHSDFSLCEKQPDDTFAVTAFYDAQVYMRCRFPSASRLDSPGDRPRSCLVFDRWTGIGQANPVQPGCDRALVAHRMRYRLVDDQRRLAELLEPYCTAIHILGTGLSVPGRLRPADRRGVVRSAPPRASHRFQRRQNTLVGDEP